MLEKSDNTAFDTCDEKRKLKGIGIVGSPKIYGCFRVDFDRISAMSISQSLCTHVADQ